VTTAPEGSTTASPGAEEANASDMDAEDSVAVLRSLATSIALLPQAPPTEGEERPEGAIALPVIEQDGRQFIPVFTSEESLRAAGADVDTAVRIPIAQLAANWPSDDVWLAVNPASEDGLGLPPDVVRALPVFAGQGNVTFDGMPPAPETPPS
jgi:SseB protein N-terminal domain